MRGETEVDVHQLPAERWDVRHQWQREHQDQHEAHETQQWRDTLGEHVNMRVVLVFLVLVLVLLSHSFLAHIAWLKSPSVCLISSMREVTVSSDFLDLFITFIFLLSFLINLKQFLLPFNFPEVK